MSQSEAVARPSDEKWMQLALDVAAAGLGYVEPNPLVGCVLVSSDGDEIGRGWHAKFGGAHAERAALENARSLGNADRIPGCTAYVTLEPCCHHGKTPPCTDALIDARVGRVVMAMVDPFGDVAGAGRSTLLKQGIGVTSGILEAQARKLNAPYLKRVQTQIPWVIAKWAMSVDGRIATHAHDSQWISGEESRRFVHELRGRVDAVMVGSGTVQYDDPSLTVRFGIVPKRTPLRIAVDSSLAISIDAQLVATAADLPTLVLCGPDADAERIRMLESRGVDVFASKHRERQERTQEFLHYLVRERNVTNLLVEGGAQLLGGLFDGNWVDACEVFIAPKVIGGEQAIGAVAGMGVERVMDAHGFELQSVTRRGGDVHLSLQRITGDAS